MVGEIARDGTSAYREWMLNDAIEQYRDYFEDDEEEMKFFEYLDNISNRDKIRFLEIFEDYSIPKHDQNGYIMIPKREFNPELSTFSNLLLDLADFKDRVRPMALDISRLDISRKYQPRSIKQLQQEEQDMLRKIEDHGTDLSDIKGIGTDDEGIMSLDDRGYSSLEIAEKSEGDTDAAKPDYSAQMRDDVDDVDEEAN